MQRILGAMRDGLRAFREHPQLWLTIVVAAAIFASFIYVADSFTGIARSAQEQLIRVRIGSLQDAFAPLAGEVFDRPDVVREYMRRMRTLNPTITEFHIVAATGTDAWIVSISTEPETEGNRVYGLAHVLSLARNDPQNSYTIEESDSAGRYFRTARAVVRRDGSIPGVVLTRQTLSAADAAIGESIRNAFIALLFILLFLLLLFFRHARIIDYAVLYRKLRGIDALKDEFIAMASHELRAPLTAIRGYIDLLNGPEVSSEDRAQWLGRVDASAKNLENLIEDMLDVSRIEQGRMRVAIAPTDPAPLFSEIADTWRTPAAAKGLTLSAEIAPGLVIPVDPDRLRQIVTNLLSNAVKYTKTGGIALETHAEAGRLVLRVSDTGIGMSNEEREKLFGKFYRAAGQDVRKERGTGLGLWITKQLVELMGGRIAVESIRGVGTHFIVSFPLSTS